MRLSWACVGWFGLLAFGFGATARAEPNADLAGIERADIGLTVERAVRFLAHEQKADGTWRSQAYPPLADGMSLTALVTRAVLAADDKNRDSPCWSRGAAWLASHANDEAASYPTYTAAGALVCLADRRLARYDEARRAWLARLLEQQMTEPLGWSANDRAYGGWGYAAGLPRKPARGELLSPLAEANLSATVFALDALQTAGASGDVAREKARQFLRRCQNLGTDARFDDGGFFFIADDDVRNKAGTLGRDATGHARFASYGSTTADGLRGLLLCGLAADDPRVSAASHWMQKNFSATVHPGRYCPDREHARNALYFYYASSIAHTWLLEPRSEAARARARALAAALVARQLADGSWANEAVDVREDDPLVATPLAVFALTTCRKLLD